MQPVDDRQPSYPARDRSAGVLVGRGCPCPIAGRSLRHDQSAL